MVDVCMHVVAAKLTPRSTLENAKQSKFTSYWAHRRSSSHFSVPCRMLNGRVTQPKPTRARTCAVSATAKQSNDTQPLKVEPVQNARKESLVLSERVGSNSIEYVRQADGEWVRVDTVKVSRSTQVLDRVKELFLPSGYPHTVTPDYVEYQLWALPVHITGWIAHSLVTSSMLKAVGVGADPTSTAAAGAAIKWITKDGFGALGRYLVGSTLARYFDEDPRQWRLVADFVNSAGSLLEISTAVFPASAFTLLAGTGNFAKAYGKGISRPSFRVIQNHFASDHNIGDVAAKEEVWEVTAQLAGLALSVLLLDYLRQQQDSAGTLVVGCWFFITCLHLALRYKSLSVLQLPSLSQKRACILARHFLQHGVVPTVREVCSDEPLIIPKQALDPVVYMNASVPQLASAAAHLRVADSASDPVGPAKRRENGPGTDERRDSDRRSGGAAAELQAEVSRSGSSANQPGGARPGTRDHLDAALTMYQDEAYVLLPGAQTLHGFALARALSKQQYLVALKADRGGALKAVLQAAWLSEHCSDGDMTVEDLRASLAAATAHYDKFVSSLQRSGWDTSDVSMPSPQQNLLVL